MKAIRFQSGVTLDGEAPTTSIGSCHPEDLLPNRQVVRSVPHSPNRLPQLLFRSLHVSACRIEIGVAKDLS
jgi:hypothetical protein